MTITDEVVTSTGLQLDPGDYVLRGSDGTLFIYNLTPAERKKQNSMLKQIAEGRNPWRVPVEYWCCRIGPRQTPCPKHSRTKK
jgi:hypothetical protein